MKSTFGGESRFQKFINGKGFYVALAACLLAIGAVAVALTGDSLFSTDKGTPEPPVSEAEPVEQIVTNQPDDRTTTTTVAPTTTTTTLQKQELYVLPFGNLVQKAYSNGSPAYCETMGDWRLHNGADFAGELGQTVKAVAKGTVKTVYEDPLWGETVTVDHGLGVETKYCGVKSSVKVGSTVNAGEKLGVLVEIPCEFVQEPHLHLEMTVDGAYADPVTAIGSDVRYKENDGE